MFNDYFRPSSREETRDILISVGALTLAFFILNAIHSPTRLSAYDAAEYMLEAVVGMASAFLLHELSHRYLARKYGGTAYFRMWPFGIVLALITSVIGIIFAAPGAVNISGLYGKDQVGKIALAGPMTNLILGIIFLGIAAATLPGSLMSNVFYFAATINVWFSFFNMIPFPPLDGSKVIRWNMSYYLIFTASSLAMAVYLFF
ncbi:MAG: site-2 protease family protein [Thermoplasmataceae archaeon]